jgi:hypothetical protein
MIGPSNAGDDTLGGGDAIKGPMSLVDMPHRKSPEEMAAAHKKAISDALLPVLALMDAAKADGFKMVTAYEDAGRSGLCAEGRWEMALDSLRSINLSNIVS